VAVALAIALFGVRVEADVHLLERREPWFAAGLVPEPCINQSVD
jgi:hypothetical protein